MDENSDMEKAYQEFTTTIVRNGWPDNNRTIERTCFDAGYLAAKSDESVKDEYGHRRCQCGHFDMAHRDAGYDADVAGSMPGTGSCTEDRCPCTKFNRRAK